MDGAEGAGGGDQLDELRAVTKGPLGPKGAGQGGPKGEGLARAVEVEDGGYLGRQEQQRERTKSEREKKTLQGEKHPQFPLTGQAHKAWRKGRAEVKEKR